MSVLSLLLLGVDKYYSFLGQLYVGGSSFVYSVMTVLGWDGSGVGLLDLNVDLAQQS